jgi:hypothetical protein
MPTRLSCSDLKEIFFVDKKKKRSCEVVSLKLGSNVFIIHTASTASLNQFGFYNIEIPCFFNYLCERLVTTKKKSIKSCFLVAKLQAGELSTPKDPH